MHQLDVDPSKTSSLDEELLTSPEGFQRKYGLLFKLTHHCNVWMSYLSSRPKPKYGDPVPYVILTVPSLILMALTIIPLALFRYDPPESALVYVYLGVTLFLIFWASEQQIRKVLPTLKKIPIKDDEVGDLWKPFSSSLRYQALPGILFVLFSFSLIFRIIEDIFGLVLAWPAYIFLVFLIFLWGHVGYVATITSLRFPKILAQFELPLYAFNPQKSPFFRDLTDFYEVFLWTSAVSVIQLIVPWVFVRKTILINIVGLSISVGGLGLLIAIYVNAQLQLNRIVRRKKNLVALELQNRINEFYPVAVQQLNKDRYEELRNLINLHDTVVDSPDWGLSATRTVRYISSFILPFLAALLANYEFIVTSFEWIRSWIGI